MGLANASVQGGSSTPGPKPAESLPSPAGLGRSSVLLGRSRALPSGRFLDLRPPLREEAGLQSHPSETEALPGRWGSHRTLAFRTCSLTGAPATGTCHWALLYWTVRRVCKSHWDSAACIRTRERQARTRGPFLGAGESQLKATLEGAGGSLAVSSE